MTDRAIRSQAWAGGSDAPEKSALDIGFMALTDSASLIVAATQGFAQPYGLTLNLRRQPSWATLRDKLLSGELDAAQCLYGLVYGVQLGLGGSAASEMAVLMGLCQNGQAINLSEPLKQAGVTSAEALLRHRRQNGARLTLAQTFPTGTHALWLNYWLASIGLHPLHDVHSVVVPPAQMVGHLQAGRIDGFCAGGPWGAGRGPGPGLHHRHQPGDLAGPPGKGPRHYPRLRRRLPEHRPRAGHGGPRRQPLHRTERREPPGHRATDQRPRLCRRSARRDPAALLRPLPGRPRQRLAGPASAAFLCRRRSQPALALGWHVVHDPIPPLGPAARRPGLPGHRPEGPADRAVPRCRDGPWPVPGRRRHAPLDTDRRAHLGRQRPRRYARSFPIHALAETGQGIDL